MNPQRLGGTRLLADEGFDPEALAFLRLNGFDVTEVRLIGLSGKPDSDIIAAARADGRVVLTHDSDFGTFAVLRNDPAPGIVYIRPGHVRAEVTIETLRVLLTSGPLAERPFILVAHNRASGINIRYRQLPR